MVFLSVKMKIDDKVRLAVLEALLQKNSVKPDLKRLKQHTGLHKATIKSSLDFLERQGVISGYGPKVNFRKLGFNLEVTTLFQADLSKKSIFEDLIKKAESDPHLYWFSGMLGSSNWNLVMRQVYRDVESYRRHFEEHYFKGIPSIYDFIKDRQILFTTEPVYKATSRTNSIIESILVERGLK
ncbi:MAG: Lrp/AsnC family transcriptional regulator [Candidatus Diapherotrites archaeon]